MSGEEHQHESDSFKKRNEHCTANGGDDKVTNGDKDKHT